MVRFARSHWGLALLLWASPALAQVPAFRAELKESSPNPISSSATLEFEIRSEVCQDGYQPTVSLRIYNVLVQVVAVPVLDKPPNPPIANLRLPCGKHQARWDGLLADGEPARTGVYYAQLTVDGQRFTRKLIVKRKGESRR